RQADREGENGSGGLSGFAERFGHAMKLLLIALVGAAAWAQVTPERLLRANAEPRNWLSYSGGYMSQRYSPVKQVAPAKVKNLRLKLVFQANSTEKFETTPLVVDGVMYLT